MCGAFSILHPFRDASQRFNVGYNGPALPPRYNARPGQLLPVILNTAPRVIQLALWGITPPWQTSRPIINARAESLETKPTFTKSFRERRCLILADGFYEWGMVDGSKIPFRFVLKTKQLFAFAGLWREDPETKQPTFAIITTEPNELVIKVHDRMPAILPLHKELDWLQEKQPALLGKLLVPYPAHLMQAYPVSTLVNYPKNDTPAVIKPIRL